jgi:hypothetical protein
LGLAVLVHARRLEDLMVADPVFFETELRLTGRTRHRCSPFNGRMILQVEEQVETIRVRSFQTRAITDTKLRWRDATFDDYYHIHEKVNRA